MTSHLITEFATRAQQQKQDPHTRHASDCAFCNIIKNGQPAFKVFENEHVLAILDILPVRQGHVLVMPKEHISRLSELPETLAGEIGKAVTKVSQALAKALDNTGLNVVCNQEYAQAVPHVHYHIVPAPLAYRLSPTLDSRPTSRTSKRIKGSEGSGEAGERTPYASMLKAEFHLREELVDEDGARLAELIKAKL